MDAQDRVTGRIARAHGVRGEVLVDIHTDEPQIRFAQGVSIILLHKEKRIIAKIIEVKHHGQRLIMSFDIVKTRDDAENLRGALCLVNTAELDAPTDPEEFYDWQLEGLTVQDGSEDTIGTVSEILHLPAGEVLVIHTPENVELLLPFTKEFVPDINLTEGYMTVYPPNGLWDSE